ncbi:serine-rich adhesin for platelets isoform X1 [Hyalella azteca]|uniref:Serine-rich adhesin for platelets isoform X1 n=1 Tax=Hyalella azteca TaxID=294128 RepID=A0A8B7N068_HYAAZ|nr:serine-rich adhesin for platelets isoform X1 [Hyalella azteca]
MDLAKDPSITSSREEITAESVHIEDAIKADDAKNVMISNIKKEHKQTKMSRRRKSIKNECVVLDGPPNQMNTRSSKSWDDLETEASPKKELTGKSSDSESALENKNISENDSAITKLRQNESIKEKKACLPANSFEGKQAGSAESSVSTLQPPILQALGLTRGLGIGVGLANTISLGKSQILSTEQQNRTAQTTAVTATTGTLPKTVPLLLNMPTSVGAGAGSVSSLLPANLPPGRYVIISSTSASSSSPLATITTTTSSSSPNKAAPAPLAVASLQAISTAVSSSLASSPVTAAMPVTMTKRSVTRLTPNGSVLKTSVRGTAGKTRGMRKSYTNSEKLAMIEAVESGLRKSVVADKFGVAPSTLACIILQKEKIRRDQTKSSLSRRRIRPCNDSSITGLSPSHYHSSAASQSFHNETADGGNREDGYSKTEDGGGRETGHSGQGSGRGRSPLPFTHFLANFDQSMNFDVSQAEEIVSVPDLSQSLTYTSEGATSSPASFCVSDLSHHTLPSAASTPQCLGTRVQPETAELLGKEPEDDFVDHIQSSQNSAVAASEAPSIGSPKTRNPSHAAKNVSVRDRVKEFGDILMTDPSGETLLCWACGFRLDHTRRSTIVEHLRSRKHGRCYLVAQALKTYALSSLGSSSFPLELVKQEPDSSSSKNLDSYCNEGGLLNCVSDHEDTGVETSDACRDDSVGGRRTSGTPRPSQSEPSATRSSSADRAQDGQLSGLCLVKREVHCYSVLDQLMKDQAYTDVTITADGHNFYAHKVVLCVASGYFRRVLADQSPGVRSVVVFRDVQADEMKNILQFLYTGEATVDATDLSSFMRTAQMLEITSLCDEKLRLPTPTALSSPQINDPLHNLNIFSANALPIVTNALRQQGLLSHQTLSQFQQLHSQKQLQVVAQQLQHLREQLQTSCSQMFMQANDEVVKAPTDSNGSKKHNYCSEVQDLTFSKRSESCITPPCDTPIETSPISYGEIQSVVSGAEPSLDVRSAVFPSLDDPPDPVRNVTLDLPQRPLNLTSPGVDQIEKSPSKCNANFDHNPEEMNALITSNEGPVESRPGFCQTTSNPRKRARPSIEYSPASSEDCGNIDQVSTARVQPVNLVMDWKSRNAVEETQVHNGTPAPDLIDGNSFSAPIDMTAMNHTFDGGSKKNFTTVGLTESTVISSNDNEENFCSNNENDTPSKKLKSFCASE